MNKTVAEKPDQQKSEDEKIYLPHTCSRPLTVRKPASAVLFTHYLLQFMLISKKVDDYNINRSSIHHARQKRRLFMASKLKASFDPLTPLNLHFDGKLMMDLTGDAKMDRLPVIVSGSEVDQLFCIPKLSASTGETMANAVFEAVEF